MCGNPERLTFRYLPPTFEQHTDDAPNQQHEVDAQGFMNRRVESMTRGIRMQLALRDTSAEGAGAGSEPARGTAADDTDSQERAAQSSKALCGAVVHLVSAQLNISRSAVDMTPDGDASFAAATLQLKQADMLVEGMECKSAQTTEQHVSGHLSTFFTLARHHVRVCAFEVRAGFLAEALATIELPEWAAWVLYTYFVGQRRRAAEAEAATAVAAGEGAPQELGDDSLAAAVLSSGGVTGLGTFVTEDLTVGDVCACSLRAHAPQMAGSDIVSDSVAMYAEGATVAVESSDDDGERRRPDFGGVADGGGIAKPLGTATTTPEFDVFTQGPAVIGMTEEWNVRRKSEKTGQAKRASRAEQRSHEGEDDGGSQGTTDAMRARAALEAGVKVDKKSRNGKVQARLLFLVGDTLWVGKSKKKATKSFPLSGALFQTAGGAGEVAQHWLRICRQRAAVGPKGHTSEGSVSTMRLEVRERGTTAPGLLALLSNVAEDFHARMLERTRGASTDTDLALLQTVTTTVGSPIGASAPTFLEGMLEFLFLIDYFRKWSIN